MTIYSVTYRPEVMNVTIGEYVAKLQHSTVSKYYVGCETADEESNDINHYQCYVESTQEMTNLRKRLKKVLEVANVHALKVERHNDPQYLLGYCQKERRESATNIDAKELADADKYYEDKKSVLQLQSMSKSAGFTVDFIVEQVLQAHIDHKETCYVHAYFMEFMRKYKAQIKFHVYSKLNQQQMKKYIEIYCSEQYEVLSLE